MQPFRLVRSRTSCISARGTRPVPGEQLLVLCAAATHCTPERSPGEGSPRSSWLQFRRRCGCRRRGRCCCSRWSPWLSRGLAGTPGTRGPTAAGIGGCYCPAPHPPPPPGPGAHLPPTPHVHCGSQAAGHGGRRQGSSGGAQHLPSGAAARAGRNSRGCSPRLPALSSDSGCGEPGRRAGHERAKGQLPIAKPPATTNHPPPLPRPAGEGLSRVAVEHGDTRGGAEGAGNRPFVMSPGRRSGSLCGRKGKGVPGTAGREMAPLGVR